MTKLVDGWNKTQMYKVLITRVIPFRNEHNASATKQSSILSSEGTHLLRWLWQKELFSEQKNMEEVKQSSNGNTWQYTCDFVGQWYICGLNIKPLGEMACIVKFIFNT